MATTMNLPQQITQVRAASGLDALAGVWLILAPFIFNYAANGGSIANDVLVGVAVVLFGGVQMLGENYRSSWPSWINTLLGVWLIVAPFALGFPSGSAAMWNDIVAGAVVGLLALTSALSVPAEEV